ncbi:hypothetical protein SLS56_002327 [Neofusicoccum ribis]|uniref:Heterokaryon incompatibility domain-containing protein n=1 Tax=Neofusicoccum ribis TaxID=45134 RepID=A0ABR3T4B0_9PEZI
MDSSHPAAQADMRPPTTADAERGYPEYQYRPLESDRHIRLLKVPRSNWWRESQKALRVRMMGEDDLDEMVELIRMATKGVLFANRLGSPIREGWHQARTKLSETAQALHRRRRQSGKQSLSKLIESFGYLHDKSDITLGPFEIIHVSLDDGPQFEAVSYTWGSNEPAAKIAIREGGKIPITKNLLEALPRLADASHTHFLWIDQICINQKDVKERGNQVKLMREVYKDAFATYIWLTSPSDPRVAGQQERLALRPGEVSLARLVMKSLVSPTYFKDMYNGRDPELSDEGFIKRVGSLNETSEAIKAMLERPWFSRGWTVQEFVFSKKPVFLLKKGRMHPTLHLSPMLRNRAMFDGETGSARPVGANTRQVIHLREQQKQGISEDWRNLVWILTALGPNFETSELRDRIFAYLGIWKPNGFEVDYEQQVQTIFQHFTECLVQETKSLDFLGSVALDRQPKFSQLSTLPSWVPDWTAGVEEPSTVWFRPPGEQVWDACLGRAHIHSNLNTNDRLIVHGKAFDKVEWVAASRISESLLDPDMQYITARTPHNRPSLYYMTRIGMLEAIWDLVPQEFRIMIHDEEMFELSPNEILESWYSILDVRQHYQKAELLLLSY